MHKNTHLRFTLNPAAIFNIRTGNLHKVGHKIVAVFEQISQCVSVATAAPWRVPAVFAGLLLFP